MTSGYTKPKDPRTGSNQRRLYQHIFKLSKIRNRILTAARRRKLVTWKRAYMSLSSDFSQKLCKQEEEHDIFKMLKKKTAN